MKRYFNKSIHFILIGVLIFNPVGTVLAGSITQVLSSNHSMPCKMKDTGHSHTTDIKQKQKLDHSSMAKLHNTGCKCLKNCKKNNCSQNCNNHTHAFVVVSSFENPHIILYSPLNKSISNIHHQIISIQHFRPPRAFSV